MNRTRCQVHCNENGTPVRAVPATAPAAQRGRLGFPRSKDGGGGVIGKVGRVTGRVGPGLVGEIMVSVRGGSEAFYAHPQRPDEEIEPGAQVLIVDFQAPRTAYVERWQSG